MTVDRLPVQAPTAKDAEDVARREWERDGFRMGEVHRVFASPRRGSGDGTHWWVVEAEVEVIR